MGKIGQAIRIFKNSTSLRHILCTVKCVYFKSSAWWVWTVVHTGVTIAVKLWIHPSSQNSLCPSSVSSPDSLAPGNYWSAFSHLRLDLSFLEFQSNGHPLSFPSPAPNPSQHQSFPTPQFKSINFSVLSFLYSPTFTSIHDYWKNHSFD